MYKEDLRFCKTCGLWFGEYMACERPDCELETWEEAARRERKDKCAAVQAEREACAKVAEDHKATPHWKSDFAPDLIAAAIRARGEEEG